jgi:aspartyl aminopeptidase
MQQNINQELIRFIARSASPYHAVREVAETLDRNGFSRLAEADRWKLERGKKHYVTRNGTSLIAFSIGTEGDAFRVAAAHVDSPTFRIKQKAELNGPGSYLRINVEPYGGAIASSWLDRPLGIAGRVLVRDGSGIASRLIESDRDVLLIPNLCIHFNRDVNKGYAFNMQTDMIPLFSAGKVEKGGFAGMIAEMASARPEDLLSWDLSLVNREPGTVWGRAEEFVSAPRLDDLQCVFSSMRGFLDAGESGGIRVLCCFDSEEVGSRSGQGALSDFLRNTLARVQAGLGNSEAELGRIEAESFLISADNAHAVHPNHPELSDSVNAVYMNEGIVIKESANQKYTSDGVSKALLRFILGRAGVPVQFYSNRSDIAGGGTLGNVSNRHFSLNTVDIGLAQLSMHSTYETAGSKDVGYMVDGVKAFFEAVVSAGADGTYSVK